MKRFRTVIPIYDWADLTVRITEAIIDRDGTLSRGAYYRNEDNCYIDLDPNRLTHGAITHEAGHCAMDILHVSGVTVTPKNDEAKAYLQDWIVRWIEYRLFRAGIRVGITNAFRGHSSMPRTKKIPKFKE